MHYAPTRYLEPSQSLYGLSQGKQRLLYGNYSLDHEFPFKPIHPNPPSPLLPISPIPPISSLNPNHISSPSLSSIKQILPPYIPLSPSLPPTHSYVSTITSSWLLYTDFLVLLVATARERVNQGVARGEVFFLVRGGVFACLATMNLWGLER